nr:hypothetical protein [Paraburkholderia silvatlantica]
MIMEEKISLRSLVEKWLAPTAGRPGRVTRLGRTANGTRYVCIEASAGTRYPLSIAFFQHATGAWCVFPPTPQYLGLRP